LARLEALQTATVLVRPSETGGGETKSGETTTGGSGGGGGGGGGGGDGGGEGGGGGGGGSSLQSTAGEAFYVVVWAQQIAGVFNRVLPFFRMYSSYCTNYSVAIGRVADMEKASKPFSEFLNSTGLSLKLTDYLIKPVQRICKYVKMNPSYSIHPLQPRVHTHLCTPVINMYICTNIHLTHL
jgi:hypothetical protein